MCTYRLFGRCRIRPNLDMPGEGENFATTTPVHGPGIKMGFCRIFFSKGRDTPTGWVPGRRSGRRRNDGRRDRDRSWLGRIAVWQTQSRVSWMLTTTVFCCSRQSLGLFAPAPYATRRTYALSRFSQRSPGVGRRRQHIENDNYRKGTSGSRAAREEVPHEDQPSSETSPLWQESVRSINSDPAEGLRRLLMTHESLVVTRSAFSGPAT